MKNLLTISTLLVLIFFSACDESEDSDPMKNLNLNISGLEDLGSEAIYEGWLIVDGVPVSSGTFSVDANGNMSKTSFSVNATDLDANVPAHVVLRSRSSAAPGSPAGSPSGDARSWCARPAWARRPCRCPASTSRSWRRRLVITTHPWSR